LRVLVVEDDADSAAGLARFLQGIGHEGEVAPDGQAAVEAAKARRPDVVLLDVRPRPPQGVATSRAPRSTREETLPARLVDEHWSFGEGG
jgi:DNA-binding response OmpR family regulator